MVKEKLIAEFARQVMVGLASQVQEVVEESWTCGCTLEDDGVKVFRRCVAKVEKTLVKEDPDEGEDWGFWDVEIEHK